MTNSTTFLDVQTVDSNSGLNVVAGLNNGASTYGTIDLYVTLF